VSTVRRTLPEGTLFTHGWVWLLVALLSPIGSPASAAWAGAVVETVAVFPGGSAAYGVAGGPDGRIYVTDASGPQVGTIFVFGPSGRVEDRIVVPAGPTGLVALRGLAFDSFGNLHVADIANGQAGRGRILRVTPTGRLSVFASGLTAPGAIAFDASDVLYVTDGVNGAVHWFGRDGASAVFVEDDRLRPHHNGLGATGLAFGRDGTLYVSNASDDRILGISINPDGFAGYLSVVADGSALRNGGNGSPAIEGPEGLAVDERGNLLVTASRSNEVELLTPQGRPLASVPASGDSSLSWPTSLALFGGTVYVANLAAEQGLSHLSRFDLADVYGD
jgi:sugar lactone lactonase YvrE